MTIVRIMQWIGGIAGLAVLTLGLVIWIAQVSLTSIQVVHALFGLIVVLTLLILGIIALLTRGMRLLGTVSVLYAPIVPIFGVTQETLLVGDLHWLVRTAHLLVGLGALTLLAIISLRYLRLKQTAHDVSRQPQPVR
jgi:hypothetical protein